jgi:hypothetical protein
MTPADMLRWFFLGALMGLIVILVGAAFIIAVYLDECEKAGGKPHLDDWLLPLCIMPKK